LISEINIIFCAGIAGNRIKVEGANWLSYNLATNCLDNGMKLALVSRNVGHKNKSTTLNTYYKYKNDVEDNLAIQNEIFKNYDFDFGGGEVEAMFA